MTLRLKMLRTAGKGLAHDQRLETAEFILSRQCADGGFAGRRGGSDLYYTSFALDGLLACGGPVAAGAVERYISSFGVGESLDMVLGVARSDSQ